MLHEFLDANRTALVDRCRIRVAGRLAPRPIPGGLEHGVAAFLGQVVQAIRLEHDHGAIEGGAAAFGPAAFRLETQIGATAAKHGHELLLHGFTVEQVVHDYGDLAQAIVELAGEEREPIPQAAFGILARCLDAATAGAVTEFYRQRDRLIAHTDSRAMGERLALLAQELRGLINTVTLSYVAIKEGGVGLHGATSAVLETSLVALNDLMEHELRDVRVALGAPAKSNRVAVERFMAEATVAASLKARSRGCQLTVASVEPGLVMEVDVQMLHSALFDVVQNALETTRPNGQVWLKARASEDRVLIEVEDRCGGLGGVPRRSGWGRDDGISRRAIEAMGGSLRFQDLPGLGCVSTIDLPRARASSP